jgi:membrane protease YdiL (CAAX protease family)
VHVLLGAGIPTRLLEIPPLVSLLLPLLVVGNEIGWRGYALPRLLRTHSALSASAIIGLLAAGSQLPGFALFPDTLTYQRSFLAFCVWALPLTALITWLFLQTRGRLMMAATLHSGAALSIVVLGCAIGVERAWVLQGAVIGALVLGLRVVLGPGLVRNRMATSHLRTEASVSPADGHA